MILVTGGAGYIGSVVVEQLLQHGAEVVVLDNLRQGHRSALPPHLPFATADCTDLPSLDDVFRRFPVDTVVHLAAHSVISASVTDPGLSFRNNIVGGINLLDTMVKHNVRNIIFSSSAATYSEPAITPIPEDHPQSPLNPYGETKLMFERILHWYGKAHGLQHVSLRYFNAAGASDRLGEDHRPETHLVPNVLKAALTGAPVAVFGDDYPTPDGTCIRDYVHVLDIAQAHLKAITSIDRLGGRAFNLGNGNGYSVFQVIEAARGVCNRPIQVTISPRRQGDPSVLVASCDKARRELGWDPHFNDLPAIVGSAWQWLVAHPEGYYD